MCVKWLATVRSPRNRAVGNLAIGAPFGDENRDTTLGRSEPLLTTAPADAAELLTRLLDPGQSPESLEAVQRREDRVAGRTLLPRASMDDAERKQRAGPPVGISDGFVLRDRLLQEQAGPCDVAVGGGDEPAGSRYGGEHPLARNPRRVGFPDVDEPGGVVRPTQLQEELGVVGCPPADARLAPRERRRQPFGLLEPLCSTRRISAPERDESQDCVVLRQTDMRGLRVGEPERPLGMPACELEVAAMDGDDGDRKVILRHLQPVLGRDVVRAAGVRSREIPAPREELDPGEAPESPSGARLVPLAPLSVLALEQRASLVPLRRRRECVHDRLCPLAHQLLAADGVREVVCHRREILRRLGLADEPAEDRLHRARAPTEHVVVDVVGELEGCASVVEASLESRGPRDAAVNDRSERRARRRFAQGLLEQAD